jgi:hypothetical protein
VNAAIARMLAHIPVGAGHDPDAMPALLLEASGEGSAALSDLALYLSAAPAYSAAVLGVYATTANPQGVAIDLHGLSVQQVAGLVPPGITATVLRDGPAELLLWPGQTGGVQAGPLPVTLSLATAPLWQLLAVFARSLESRRRNLQSAIAQINIRSAVGMWLDWWAASLGITRHAGEPDSLFAARLVGTTLEPRVNNVAIEQLFAALGYTVTAADTGPGQAGVNVTYPTNPPAGFVYSQAQIAAIVGQVKAVGVQAVVNFLSAFSDAIGLGPDAATATTPGGPMVWGSSAYAEASLA